MTKMELAFTCNCGHHNKWSIFSGKISNFICEKCGEFVGACNSHEVRFSESIKGKITYDYDNGIINVRRATKTSYGWYYPQGFSNSASSATSDYLVGNRSYYDNGSTC